MAAIDWKVLIGPVAGVDGADGGIGVGGVKGEQLERKKRKRQSIPFGYGKLPKIKLCRAASQSDDEEDGEPDGGASGRGGHDK